MPRRADIPNTTLAPQTDLRDPGISRRGLMLGAIAAGVAGLAPWQSIMAQATNRDTFTVAYPVDVPTWDPTSITVPDIQGIFQSVFDSPLRYSPDAKLEARQFTSWKWATPDKTRLDITIRDDIFFHDGSKLTMEDVKFSLYDRPKADSRLIVGGMLGDVADFEVHSPTSGTIVYRKPFLAGPFYLAFMSAYILPKAYLTKVGVEGFNAHPIGAGPYRLVEHQRGSKVALEAFDKYWGGKPAIKQVVFQITPEPASRVALIESGQADMSIQLPVREVERLSKKPGIKTQIYPVSVVYMIRIPNYVKPLDNEHVRRAMHYAINKEALSKAFYAGNAVPRSIITPVGSSDDVPGLEVPFDKAKAIDELKQAGYGPDKPVSFTLLTTNGAFPSDYDVARAVVQMWKAVGINATIEESTPPKILEATHTEKLSGAVVSNWTNITGDPDGMVGRLLDPRLRFATWKDPALGPRLDSLVTETDENKRLAGYKDLIKEATEHAWVIPMVQGIATVAYGEHLRPLLFKSGYIVPFEYKNV